MGAFDVGDLLAGITDLLGQGVGGLSDLTFLVMLLLFMAFDTTGTTRELARIGERRPDLVAALDRFVLATPMMVLARFGFIVAVLDTLALWLMGVPGAFVWVSWPSSPTSSRTSASSSGSSHPP